RLRHHHMHFLAHLDELAHDDGGFVGRDAAGDAEQNHGKLTPLSFFSFWLFSFRPLRRRLGPQRGARRKSPLREAQPRPPPPRQQPEGPPSDWTSLPPGSLCRREDRAAPSR